MCLWSKPYFLSLFSLWSWVHKVAVCVCETVTSKCEFILFDLLSLGSQSAQWEVISLNCYFICTNVIYLSLFSFTIIIKQTPQWHKPHFAFLSNKSLVWVDILCVVLSDSPSLHHSSEQNYLNNTVVKGCCSEVSHFRSHEECRLHSSLYFNIQCASLLSCTGWAAALLSSESFSCFNIKTKYCIN